MIRNLTAAVVGTLLLTGIAAAQSTTPFPMSVNDAGPNYSVANDGRTYNPFGRFAGGRAAPEASQVDESHPGHTGGQDMPSMRGSRGATSSATGAAGSAAFPSSVDETHPGHTAGQSMPSMGYGR